MPYRYLENIAIADIAFEAYGSSVGEIFIAAGDALTNVMVENLDVIEKNTSKSILCDAESLEMLLHKMLDELLYYKDAEQLLLRVAHVDIVQENDTWRLNAQVYGERIDPVKHELNVDVKAVTFHRFALEQTAEGWKVTVVLDI